jgi:glycosyltransferase involved in cell wall biosynthesis
VSHVVIVAAVHAWDDVRVYQKEACTLAAHGYNVTLIAQAPQTAVERGIRIQPAPKSKSRTIRFLKLPLVFLMAMRLDADIYHVHNPDMIPVALLLKLSRKRVIYDTHEDFAQRLLIRAWIPPSLRSVIAHLVVKAESVVGRIANASIVTQEAVRRRLGDRAVLIENPPITHGFLIDEAHAHSLRILRGDELRLIYVGGLGATRGLDVMIDAVAILNARGIETRLWLIGTGNEAEVRTSLSRPGGVYVDYLGRLPQAKAFAFMIKADIGLVTILDVGDHSFSSANKLYEYITFGLPVVASDFQRWRNSLPTSPAIIFVPAGDAAGVAAAIDNIAAMPDRGKRHVTKAQKHLHERYNWEAESVKLLRVYTRILNAATK